MTQQSNQTQQKRNKMTIHENLMFIRLHENLNTVDNLHGTIISNKLNTEISVTNIIFQINYFLTSICIYFQESSTMIPPIVDISGDCSKADDAKLVMKWKSFELSWYFSKVTVIYFHV